MKSRSAIAGLAFLLAAVGWASAGPEEAVVTIWVDLEGQPKSFGSGFFISADGRVLTSYHVVEGARRITVYHGGSGYPSVVVDAIGPTVDLAVLRVEGLPTAVPYLRLADPLPPNAAGDELTALGHAAGIRDQAFRTRMTRPSFVKSREFRNRRGALLFARDDLDLIALDLTIYNGLSGGPVVSRYGVLGVVSGSLDEGGSIAWAIPSKYAIGSSLTPVNRRPADLQWPQLKLMGGGWTNLRSRILLNDGLADALGRYFESVEVLREVSERLFPTAASMIAVIDGTVAVLDGAVAQQTTNHAAVQAAMTVFETRAKALEALEMEGVTALTAVASLLFDVHERIDGMPLTPRNAEQIRRMNQLFVEVGQQLEKPRAYMDSLSKAQSAMLSRHAAAVPDLPRLRALMLDLRAHLMKVCSPETMRQLKARVAAYRTVGRVVEALLRQPLDDWAASWVFVSSWGYQLTLPGGWETDARMNPEIRKEMAARMLQTGSILDGVFPKWSGGWQRGNTPGLTLAVAVRKEELDSSEQSFSFFVRGVAGSLPPTTAIVGAERRIVKGRPMFIVKMVDKSADGVVTTFHVTVPARQRILTFLFSTQRDLGAATWQECTAVLNGLEEE